MLGKLNMRRVRHGLVERDLLFGPVINPWRGRAPAVVSRQDKAMAASLHPQGGSSGGSSALPPFRPSSAPPPRPPTPAARSASRRPDRHGRHQADLWPLLALGHRRLRLVARPGRSDRPRRARRRGDAQGAMAGVDAEGFHVGRRCRCRTTKRRSARASRACASASRRSTASRACRRTSRRCGRRARRG
jgi:hypothetical protein